MKHLPIIDLSRAEDIKQQALFDEEFRSIARDVGFFYLVGHGVSSKTIRNFEYTAKEFFKLPMTEKLNISMGNSRHFRGYSGLEEELTRQRPDYREQIDIGAELMPDPLASDVELWRHMQGPNQWPESLPDFKPVILDWMSTMRALAIRVLHVFFRSLYQDARFLEQLVSGPPSHLLKLIHYPGSPNNPQGVGPHKDSGLLTLLLQDDVGGLQVETDHGWIDAPYLQDAFIVNIGETLELLTNGYLRANVHRVKAPSRSTERYSNAFFLAPRLDLGELPLMELPVELANQAKGPTRDPLNPLLKHVGQNAIKGRLRSHLNVTRRYYSHTLLENDIRSY